MNRRTHTLVAFLYTVFLVNADNSRSKVTENRYEFDSPCPVTYSKQGCFSDKRKPSLRAMSELLFQDRYEGRGFSGQRVNWTEWNTYLPGLVCRCATAAANKTYAFFGIQHYGECWSSADAASRFHIYGPNKNCINAEFKSCNHLVREEACAGENWANYVYEIVPQSPDGGSGVGVPIHPDEY